MIARPLRSAFGGRPRLWLSEISAFKAAVVVVAGAGAIAAGFLVASGNATVALAVAVGLPVAAIVIRYPFAGVLVWAAVMPFFVRTDANEAGAPLWLLHRLGVPAMLVLLTILHQLGLRRRPFRLHPIDAVLLAFLVMGALNVLVFAPNPIRMGTSFYEKVAVPILLFWVIRAASPERIEVKRLLALGAVMIGVQVAISAVAWLMPALLPSAWLGRAGERTAGSFGGPAPYSITLVFFGLLAVYWLLTNVRLSATRRAVLVAIIAIALLGVFLSLSRGSWLGAVLAFGGLVFVAPRVVLRIGAVAVVVLLLVAVVGPFREQLLFAQSRIEDVNTVDSRIITNDAAVRMIATRPLTGFGYGNFEQFDETFKQRVGDIPLKLGGSAHNTYLNFAVEFGLPAFILYFGVPAWMLVRSLRHLRQRRAVANPARLLVIVGWLAILDQFVVSNFLEMIHPNLWGTSLWWLTLGLIWVADEAGERLPVRGRGHRMSP